MSLRYLPVTLVINDEPDNFGNNGPVFVQQSKEERENKAAKVYLGNAKVVWSNGSMPNPGDGQPGAAPVAAQAEEEDDLPF